MKKYHLLLLSILSGLLLTFAWPANGWPGLLFVAFIPLFFIEDHIQKNKDNFHLFSVMFYTYPGFLIWTALTTWWIIYASPFGAGAAVLINALFMAFILNLYHITRRFVFFPRQAQLVFVIYWICFEYIHLNWDLNWPWLNLGNGFASYNKWIQWYEFTGTFGGTLWILLVNIALYRFVQSRIANKRFIFNSWKYLAIGLLLLFIPLTLSFVSYHNYKEQGKEVSIVVVQPNIDPYKEQYILDPAVVIKRNLDLAIPLIKENTDFVVSPESAIQEDIYERRLYWSPSLNTLKSFVRDYHDLGYIIGASTDRVFLDGEKISHTARKFRNEDKYYDSFNTAIYIDKFGIEQWSHKSRLTPGVEVMPLIKYFKFLENLALDLGGTIGSLGTDKERVVFYRKSDSLKFGAAICYESIFGDFYSEFVLNGADLMFIITNDGWWRNTAGYRQHNTFASLRAIETRRSIARSANTGISCFVNQRGDIFQETKYGEPDVIKQSLITNDKLTFYTRYGDFIARISAFIGVILLLYTFAGRFMKKRVKL